MKDLLRTVSLVGAAYICFRFLQFLQFLFS